jgi:putative transposase
MVTHASRKDVVVLESRMQGQLACPVWRALGRNGSQQWENRAPLRPYITFVPMPLGYMYLVAIMDWFSRFVVAWQLSNTLDGVFCLNALRFVLRHGQPEIFNTDQDVQFTAHDFTGELEAANIRISMDGRGRVFDNIFVERLWRTVKYEDIYIKEYATVPALAAGLDVFFNLYNYERPHQSLGYLTPADVHFAVKEPIL